MKPLAVSMGEPAGIGPDLVIQLASCGIGDNIPWLVTGSPSLLASRAKLLGTDLELNIITNLSAIKEPKPGQLHVLPIELAQPVIAGKLNKANSSYVLAALKAATDLCCQGKAKALVTAPCHKGIICQAGFNFTGHTGWLANYCQAPDVVMMLAYGNYRVALATTHIPLQQVAQTVSAPLLTQKIKTLAAGLKQHFGILTPKIAVCGLNPHAGEGGHLGREEIDIIAPALDQLKNDNYQVIGPLPADTLLAPRYACQYDAVLALYHDQGLAPLKALYFDQAVNISLGLPFLRTSVDHGTALDLAGTGRATSTSLRHAIELAAAG